MSDGNPLTKIEGSAPHASAKAGDTTVTTPPAPAAGQVDVDAVFAQKHAELLKTMADMKTQLESKDKAASEATQKLAQIEAAAREAERAKMSDMDRFKADLADQQKQIQELLKSKVEIENKLIEERAINTKNAILGKSGLKAEFQKFVHGTDPIDIQKQVDELLAIQNSIKTEALSSVPTVVKTEQVGAPPAAPQGQPTAGEPTKTGIYDKLKGTKNVQDLASLFYKDGEAKNLLLNRR